MLKISVVLCSIILHHEIFAQSQPYIEFNFEKFFKNSPINEKIFELPNTSNLNVMDLLKEIQGNQSLQIDTARYSHSNSTGSVYVLPGSSMPVYKPHEQGSSALMPGTIQHNLIFIPQTGTIPNGLKIRRMEFEQPPAF